MSAVAANGIVQLNHENRLTQDIVRRNQFVLHSLSNHSSWEWFPVQHRGLAYHREDMMGRFLGEKGDNEYWKS